MERERLSRDLAAALDEIERLNAENTLLKAAPMWAAMADGELQDAVDRQVSARAAVKEMRRRLAALRELSRCYGDHTAGCPARDQVADENETNDCTCGYAQALAECGPRGAAPALPPWLAG